MSVVQTVSVMVAAASVVIGISAWRRAELGKRNLDLAEEVTSIASQVRDALNTVRSPFGGIEEGKTRIRGTHETQEESELLDRAFVTLERLSKHDEVFAKMHAIRARMRLHFGAESIKPLDSLTDLRWDLIRASRKLGLIHWRQQGREFPSEAARAKHLDEMWKNEGIIWAGAENPDETQKKIDEAYKVIEDKMSSLFAKKRTFKGDLATLRRDVRDYFFPRN